jgi:SAM-dependent methyltransferase
MFDMTSPNVISELRVILSQARKLFCYLRCLDLTRAAVVTTAIFWRVFDDVRLIIHNSRKVKCEYCDWEGNNFFIYKDTKDYYNRLNALCPRCGSGERHRLLLRYLKDRTPFFARELGVLDIAPITAFQELCLRQPNLGYASIDLVSRLAMARMDVTSIAFPDNEFDVIICYHVLEHVKDDLRAIRELHRVLAEDGFAILQVPVDQGLQETIEYDEPNPRECNHMRRYGRDYQLRLESAGFKVKDSDYAYGLDRSLVERYGIALEEIFVVVRCRKEILAQSS